LLFRMPLALHRLVLSQGQTPIHLGSIQWGNVSSIRDGNNRNYKLVFSYFDVKYHVLIEVARGNVVSYAGKSPLHSNGPARL
jgi:hypothetical protein